ncbi:MAG: RsmD family RNA methyltransferase [Proteobacteria bacterium]|nr:RsmD family RNA methyltransferase [Pseudomonadota bacterium]
MRPTTSRVLSALFSMFGPAGVEGKAVLDLYAGTGGFGLEALRRGASRVVMVEKSRRLCDELRQAAAKAGADSNAEVVCGDAIRSLNDLRGPFDVVFADPPYADVPFADVAERLAENSLVAESGAVLLEHFHKTELPDELPGLVIETRRRYGDTAVSVYRPK